jgi:hypothetical protein
LTIVPTVLVTVIPGPVRAAVEVPKPPINPVVPVFLNPVAKAVFDFVPIEPPVTWAVNVIVAVAPAFRVLVPVRNNFWVVPLNVGVPPVIPPVKAGPVEIAMLVAPGKAADKSSATCKFVKAAVPELTIVRVYGIFQEPSARVVTVPVALVIDRRDMVEVAVSISALVGLFWFTVVPAVVELAFAWF